MGPRLAKGVAGAALACLFLAGCADDAPRDETPPVVLIGIDGAEWTVLNTMMAEGDLPHLARFRNQGAWGYLFNPGPAVSPVAWTTFATGHFGRRHGVLAHTYPYRESDTQRPVSSELRREPALWNVADHYGKRSVVVGYFVTHPPEYIDGVMVSPLAPRGVEDSITPPDALELEAERYRELSDPAVQASLWSPYFGWDFDRSQLHDPESQWHSAARIVAEKNLDRRIIADEFLRRATLDLAREPADLFITYFRVTDFMSHSLWLYFDETDAALPPDEQHRTLFDEALRESYRFVDRVVGDLLDAWGGQANFMIVSDHGFGPARMRPGRETRLDHLTGDHRPNGIVLAMGPDIRPGEVRNMTAMEVAPTVAALLGIPVADDLPGDIHATLLEDGFLRTHPVRTVPDYSAIAVERASDQSGDDASEADMKALRGLGYIGADVGLATTRKAGEYDFWTVDDSLLVPAMASELTYFLLRGDPTSAQERLGVLQRHRPDLAIDVLRRAHHKLQLMADQTPPDLLQTSRFDHFFEANGLGVNGDA